MANKLLMLKTVPASDDGMRVREYLEGTVYPLPSHPVGETLRGIFLAQGWAVECDAEGNPLQPLEPVVVEPPVESDPPAEEPQAEPEPPQEEAVVEADPPAEEPTIAVEELEATVEEETTLPALGEPKVGNRRQRRVQP